MKSFKTILLESKQNDELRAFINNKFGRGIIKRELNRGFYIDGAQYMKTTMDGYEVTASGAIELNKAMSSFNSNHKYKIDWWQPDISERVLYIKIK